MLSEERPTTGSGSGPVYQLEARISEDLVSLGPREFCGKLFDGVWRHIDVPTTNEGIGVPNNVWLSSAAEHGFFSKDTAIALAWWLIAATRAHVEVRLVEYQFEYTYKAERRAEGDPIRHEHKRIERAEPKP